MCCDFTPDSVVILRPVDHQLTRWLLFLQLGLDIGTEEFGWRKGICAGGWKGEDSPPLQLGHAARDLGLFGNRDVCLRGSVELVHGAVGTGPGTLWFTELSGCLSEPNAGFERTEDAQIDLIREADARGTLDIHHGRQGFAGTAGKKQNGKHAGMYCFHHLHVHNDKHQSSARKSRYSGCSG